MNPHTDNTVPAPVHRAFAVIRSAAHYRTWFLENHDFSIFTDEEIDDYLRDTQPDVFPCIPLYDRENTFYPVYFISVQQVNAWAEKLRVVT